MDTDAIRRRMTEASPGPWARHGSDVRSGDQLLFRGRDGSAEVRQQANRDAEFVAHAREDIAALLDAVNSAAEATEQASTAAE